VKERYQIRGRFVLYAGNIKPHKNLDRLIAAFAQLRHQAAFEDLKLLIIGDETSRHGFLRRKVEECGVRQDVRFFGFVPAHTLAALYRLASVFAFPSLYEGFGLPPLEAMACGCPVAVSRVAALPEVCGDAAVYFDPTSAESIAQGIVEVLDRPPGGGPERAALFTWEEFAHRHDAVYRELAGPDETG
jgi:glycosyltransferase involved in cell wall biosynthesis